MAINMSDSVPLHPLSEAEKMGKQLQSLSRKIQSLVDEEQRLEELKESLEGCKDDFFPIEISGHDIDVRRELAIQLVAQAHMRKSAEVVEFMTRYKGLLYDKD